MIKLFMAAATDHHLIPTQSDNAQHALRDLEHQINGFLATLGKSEYEITITPTFLNPGISYLAVIEYEPVSKANGREVTPDQA